MANETSSSGSGAHPEGTPAEGLAGIWAARVRGQLPPQLAVTGWARFATAGERDQVLEGLPESLPATAALEVDLAFRWHGRGDWRDTKTIREALNPVVERSVDRDLWFAGWPHQVFVAEHFGPVPSVSARERELMAQVTTDPEDGAARLQLAELQVSFGRLGAAKSLQQLLNVQTWSFLEWTTPQSLAVGALAVNSPPWVDGWPDWVRMPASRFVEVGEALCSHTPLRQLIVDGPVPDSFYVHPRLAQLRSLAVHDADGDVFLNRLAGVSHAKRLQTVMLHHCHETLAGVRALAASEHLPALRTFRGSVSTMDALLSPSSYDGQVLCLDASHNPDGAALHEAFPRRWLTPHALDYQARLPRLIARPWDWVPCAEIEARSAWVRSQVGLESR